MMDRVHAAAKEQGATLNDVFLTAYARAIYKLSGRSKVNIPCTVDLRKYAKGKTGIANLTGTYHLNVRIADDAPFRRTLAAASADMQRQKRTQNDLAGPRLLVSRYESSTLDAFLKLYGGMNTGAYTDYTNLGVLDAEQLQFMNSPVRTAVGYSGLNKAPCFQIAVSSFRGETTVATLIQCGESEKEKADGLLDAVISEVRLFGAPDAMVTAG